MHISPISDPIGFPLLRLLLSTSTDTSTDTAFRYRSLANDALVFQRLAGYMRGDLRSGGVLQLGDHAPLRSRMPRPGGWASAHHAVRRAHHATQGAVRGDAHGG